MTISIAYLGPKGTYSQLAALACQRLLQEKNEELIVLKDFLSIPKALAATAAYESTLSVVPVENSIEGSVTTTLDTLWSLGNLKIQQALTMPIDHVLLSYASSLDLIEVVYSHPQALSQCQQWLDSSLPTVRLVPTNSTTEALRHLEGDRRVATISSQWAAQLYNLPVLAQNINDYPDNCTKFWVLGHEENLEGNYTSMAFSLSVNAPGALIKVLEIFAKHQINLSRIESRPSKRSLGDYLFFVDLETSMANLQVQHALVELNQHTETLKTFGSYNLLPIRGYSEMSQ